MANAEELLGLAATAIADVTNLIPSDVYSTQVLEALYAERQFEGIVPNFNEDLTREAGSTVQVPYIGARTAQGPIAEGTALTANASTTGTYPIVLEKFGDYDLVNAEVFEDQTIFSREDFTRNMGKALAEKVDQEVYDAAEGAAAASTETLAVAGNLSDLYDQVVELKAKMKKLKVRPTHLIIGPDQEAQFLKDTSEGIKLTQISVRDGQVLSVAGLSVIVSPLANANVATLNEVQAIIIDKSRALGEAWGRRPNTVVDDKTRSEFDQVKLVTWLRYGTAVLDVKAFGHVKNPAA